MLLAETPPVPQLLCTIEAVQSQWSPRSISEVRVVRGQTFEVSWEGALQVSPRYVIDSRLSVLADDRFEPEVSVGPDGAINYRWSFQALVGPVAAAVNQQPHDAEVIVDGVLNIGSDLRFSVRNRSSLVAIGQRTPITHLDETASGRCRDQS